ncbi:MAG: hypothetical protein EOP33_05435 [Rickettsiaceae bacterium]|nr:MAG: hypothetical protein EOP33_05435 [Rickettsiaceae bacterium]
MVPTYPYPLFVDVVWLVLYLSVYWWGSD